MSYKSKAKPKTAKDIQLAKEHLQDTVAFNMRHAKAHSKVAHKSGYSSHYNMIHAHDHMKEAKGARKALKKMAKAKKKAAKAIKKSKK